MGDVRGKQEFGQFGGKGGRSAGKALERQKPKIPSLASDDGGGGRRLRTELSPSPRPGSPGDRCFEYFKTGNTCWSPVILTSPPPFKSLALPRRQ